MERSGSTGSVGTDFSRSSTDTLGSLARSLSSGGAFPGSRDLRRCTFAFDEVLYSDAGLEVTPSLVTVGARGRRRRRAPFGGPREVPVQDIQRVCRDFDSPVPPPRRRTLLRRHRARAVPPPPPVHNLILVVRGADPVRVPVMSRFPADAYDAVRAAMVTEY